MSLPPHATSIADQDVLCELRHLADGFDIHVFPCTGLPTRQSLFNDGLPSIILMPCRSDIVQLRAKGVAVKLNAAWVCCGIVKETYWEIPATVDYIVVLRFKPSLFYSLFNISPAVFHKCPICNLYDIVDEAWKRVFDVMYSKRTITERISFLNEVFTSFQTKDSFPSLLNKAIDFIEEKRGNITVTDLINQLGKRVNTKWLYRNFVKYVGISPKEYITLQRFIYTYGTYKGTPSEASLDLTLHSGYYDKTHFCKDFKKYMGISPSQYRWQ